MTIRLIDDAWCSRLWECDVCLARFRYATAGTFYAPGDAARIEELMSSHVCDPFVDVAAVRSVRAQALELSAKIGPYPDDFDHPRLADAARFVVDVDSYEAWTARLAWAGNIVASSCYYDTVTLQAADVVSEAGLLPDEEVIEAAILAIAFGRRSDDERALSLATAAVSGAPFEPYRYRPVHARMAISRLDDAYERLADIAQLTAQWTLVPRDEAVARLVDFEQHAKAVI